MLFYVSHDEITAIIVTTLTNKKANLTINSECIIVMVDFNQQSVKQNRSSYFRLFENKWSSISFDAHCCSVLRLFENVNIN